MTSGRFNDLAGQRFGRLVARSVAGRDKACRVLWRCDCDCGASANVAGISLTKGLTRSCGCLRRELSARRACENGGRGEARRKRLRAAGLTDPWDVRQALGPASPHADVPVRTYANAADALAELARCWP
jgi:hypothetical protein